MKQHIRQTALVLLTVVLLVAGAAVTMIIGYAEPVYFYLYDIGNEVSQKK